MNRYYRKTITFGCLILVFSLTGCGLKGSLYQTPEDSGKILSVPTGDIPNKTQTHQDNINNPLQ